MARFVKGDVIVGYFPFSNATGAKKRPALVVASWSYTTPYVTSDCYLLCIISASAQVGSDPFTFALQTGDIVNGSLQKQSYLMPSYFFSADDSLLERKIGEMRPELFNQVLETVRTKLLIDI